VFKAKKKGGAKAPPKVKTYSSPNDKMIRLEKVKTK